MRALSGLSVVDSQDATWPAVAARFKTFTELGAKRVDDDHAPIRFMSTRPDLLSWKLLSRLVAAESIHDNDVTGCNLFGVEPTVLVVDAWS